MMRNAITAGYDNYTVNGVTSFHYGIDESRTQPLGYAVFAVVDGKVLSSLYDSAGGNMVIIRGAFSDEYDLLTRDAHLASRSVSAGDIVTAGTKIGVQGNTGSQTTAQHLHHEEWLIPKSVSYSYNGRTQYSVDPVGVSILASDQLGYDGGFNNTDPAMHYFNYMKNQLPLVAVEDLVNGTMTIVSAPIDGSQKPDGRYDYNDQTIRLYPDAQYSPIVGGTGRGKYKISHFFDAKSFPALYKCTNAGREWVGIKTPFGLVWLPITRSISITTSGEPTPPETDDREDWEKVFEIAGKHV